MSIAWLVWMLTTGTAWSQAVAGSQVSGIVKDSSGAVLPGVEVTITKTDTGTSRTVFTGADGAYVFPSLPVGPYRLKVSLQGFTTHVQDGIVLQVNTNPKFDVTLAIGSIGEQVTVTAHSVTVETRSPAVGQVIDNQQITEIPLNGRQATELIFLSGLATSAPSGDLNTNKNYPTVTISVAGGQANGVTYIMDGGTHNDPFNNLNLPTPFPDALQEFKVETSSLPARYGHHAASAVNLVTKSGTNTFHGDAFEFLRDYHFNARNFFAPARDSLKRNQFGGTLGWPLVADKLFFFGGYQGRIEKSNPPTTVSFVPTAAMLAGESRNHAPNAARRDARSRRAGGSRRPGLAVARQGLRRAAPFASEAHHCSEGLWDVELEASAHATPITYLGKDSRQYVVVASGGGSYLGSPSGTTLVAFALPAAAKSPARH